MTASAHDRARFSVTRCQFVRTTGLGLAGGSLATMLATRQAPAQIKGSNLRILTWSHFIPAYDTWFDKFAADWGEKNGVKVRVDHIPHLEIPARMAAEFAAGAGHDLIFNGATILTRIYYKNLVDLTDVYDQLGKATSVEMRWADPVPQAGSYTLETPAGKTLSLGFSRVDADTISVTVTGPRGRSFSFNVNKI